MAITPKLLSDRSPSHRPMGVSSPVRGALGAPPFPPTGGTAVVTGSGVDVATSSGVEVVSGIGVDVASGSGVSTGVDALVCLYISA